MLNKILLWDPYKIQYTINGRVEESIHCLLILSEMTLDKIFYEQVLMCRLEHLDFILLSKIID